MKEARHGKQICSSAEAVSAHAHGRYLHRDAMFDRLVEQMKKAEGVTEQLKAENQMEWVGRMNSIRSRAEEVVLSELVYC